MLIDFQSSTAVKYDAEAFDRSFINLFNIIRHYKSPQFHTVIRIHLISLSLHILISPSHFISMGKMLMLILKI